MLFTVRADGAKLCLLAASHYQKLIEVKQGCAAFTTAATLLAVAQQLVNRLRNGVIDFGGLGLNDYQRQAIYKQHHVWNDVVLSPQYAHLELANRHKAVVGVLLKIYKTHCRAFRACLAVFADAGAFKQQPKNMQVVLQQATAGKARRQLLCHIVQLVVCQPRLHDF